VDAQAPKKKLWENDSKCGEVFAREAHSSQREILKTPYQATRAKIMKEV